MYHVLINCFLRYESKKRNKSSASSMQKESGKPYPIQKQQKTLACFKYCEFDFSYVIYIVNFTVINESSLPKYRNL